MFCSKKKKKGRFWIIYVQAGFFNALFLIGFVMVMFIGSSQEVHNFQCFPNLFGKRTLVS